MDRKPQVNQLAFEDFVLHFGGKLRSDRWVILAKQIPWDEVDPAYAQQFSKENMGSSEKSSQLAPGDLILQERLGVTDRERVAQIAENPQNGPTRRGRASPLPRKANSSLMPLVCPRISPIPLTSNF